MVAGPTGAVGNLFPLEIRSHAQITATQADEGKTIVPANCRVIYGVPNEGVHGGTGGDLSLMVENGTTDIFAAVIPACLAGTAVVTEIAPVAAQASLSKGDVLHLDSTVANGTSPTWDGASVILWCQRTS